jgi:hypothetical protein
VLPLCVDVPASDLVVCIAEDRQSCEPALRILVASLAAQCPGLNAYLFCPNASADFVHWIARFAHDRLDTQPLDGPWTKYDIKPLALLKMLRRGFTDVVWIDSDIVLSADFRPIFRDLSPETVAVSEEAPKRGEMILVAGLLLEEAGP